MAALIENRGTDLATVSRAIGKNHAYLQQYFKRGIPHRLPENARLQIARVLGADPRELGARAWRPSYLDLFLFPLRCSSPECGADFRVAVRGLVARDAINCPQCSGVVDLKKLKPAINDLVRVATELDKMAEEPD